MRQNSNGINMLDVKRRNRSSILNLVHKTGGISRKDIACRLGLTPAAITLITTDLIGEGVLLESSTDQASNRKGRKEVLLEINSKKYAAVGIYISRHKLRFLCIDLNNTVIFEDTIHTADCHQKAELILNKLSQTLNTLLENYDVKRTKKLVGIGVSVNGIVNTKDGISVKSYNIWESNVYVTDYLEEEFEVPVLLTNNICSLAHGECFLSHLDHPDDMIFIKYGPGVGAARLYYENFLSISDFKAIQLGHLIVDSNGVPCVCGNQGCLETIASYDSIESTLSDIMSRDTTPVLYQLTMGMKENINIENIIKAYDAGDAAVAATLNRSIYYLAVAIKNIICLFNPKTVILYGELFENGNFRQVLYMQLKKYTDTEKVSFSHYNLQLETLGPASTIIHNFYDNGGNL